MRGGFLSVGFFCLATFVAGETVETSSSVNAFDPADPSKQIGVFQAGSSLQVGDYVESAKMYRVTFKAPDGTEIHALSLPSELGKPPPGGEGAHLGFETWTPKNVSQKDEKQDSNPKEKESPSPFQIPSKDASQPPLFDSVFQLDPTLWETTAPSFALKQSSFGFRWVSLTDQSTSRSGIPLSFLSQPVMESLAWFKEGKLEKLQLLLFGRGDAKVDLGKIEYDGMMKKAEGSLDDWLKTKGVKDEHGNAMGTERKSWFKFPLRVDLESSFTLDAREFNVMEEKNFHKGFRTEFIRLVFTSYDGKQDIAELTKPNLWNTPQNTTVKRANLKERIKHENNGDVYLEGVPMVDQGQKGYCVVAASERVMRYYGLPFDQNELAKVANSNPDGGTTPEGMIKALKKIGGQFGLTVHEHMAWNGYEFLKEMEEYDRLAKKGKKTNEDNHGMINVNAFYQNMDPEIFKKVRLKKVNEKNRLGAEVEMLVNEGAPALWSVEVGLVKETPDLRQVIGGQMGGHMRLIIGYNKKTSEIIYTDTWGVGHEFKRMSLDDAYVITEGLFSVIPST